MSTKIQAQAPSRIDLAGGTLDFWPLYLFYKGAATVTFAIDLYATTTIESFPVKKGKLKDSFIEIVSLDRNEQGKFKFQELIEATSTPASLSLPAKLLRHSIQQNLNKFKNKPFHIRMEMRAKSPAGAGLGGSSTLAMSIQTAINKWLKSKVSPAEMIAAVRDIESQVLGIPAGIQDHHAATYGGLQVFYWGIGSHTKKTFSKSLQKDLGERILLFYSGQPRNSGINNWDVYKKIIDQDQKTRDLFSRIVAATQSLILALEKKDFEAIGQAIREEWSARKLLSPTISTPQIDQAIESLRTHDIHSAKICGAGGGGCFFVYRSRPFANNEVTQIEKELAPSGIKLLPFQLDTRGATVK